MRHDIRSGYSIRFCIYFDEDHGRSVCLKSAFERAYEQMPVEDSQILFDGSFTLMLQEMSWHLTLELPLTVMTDDVAFPVTPSIDH